MAKNKLVTFSVRITEQEKATLAKIGEITGKTQTELVREAVRRYMNVEIKRIQKEREEEEIRLKKQKLMEGLRKRKELWEQDFNKFLEEEENR